MNIDKTTCNNKILSLSTTIGRSKLGLTGYKADSEILEDLAYCLEAYIKLQAELNRGTSNV